MSGKNVSDYLAKYKGWSAKKIMDIDFKDINKMGENELKFITSRLVSMGNKRIRGLEKSEIPSPALKNLRDNGTEKFSVKGKGRNQIINEYVKIKNFSQGKTSTVGGAKKVRQDYINRFGEMTPEIEKKFWGVYNRMVEMKGKYFIKQIDSDDVMDMIIQQLAKDKSKTLEELLDMASEKFDRMQEEHNLKHFSDF